jgi:hypothetical protein
MLPSSSQDILIVGDQGQPSGNDFDLLNRPYSLSVDKVSPSLSHCWNISPAGWRGANATLSLIKAMHIEKGMLYLNPPVAKNNVNNNMQGIVEWPLYWIK